MLSNIDTSLIIVYLILVIIIGYISSRKQSGSDFMIFNRKLGLLGFVSTMVASVGSGTALVVYTAYVFQFGIGTLFGLIGLALGYLTFFIAAKKLRALAHKYNFHTLSDFFHFHFGKKTGNLIAIVIAAILIMAILNQFIAGTQILSAISGSTYELALLISSAVILTYLILGGFRAVVKTDIFQHLIMIFLIFVVGFTMANKVSLPIIEFTKNTASPTLIIAFLIYGILAIWPDAVAWQRVYAAKNDRVLKLGFMISGILLVLFGLGITIIGVSARAAFPNIDPSQAIFYGTTNLLPAGILGLGIVFIFAAIMSSADTLIFVLASNISKDFISKFKKRILSPEELMKYTRINLIFIVLIATSLAYFFRNLIDISLICLGLGMALTPAIIINFKWKLNKKAISASILAGVLYVLAWVILGKISPETMTSTVFISFISLLIVQKVCKKFI